MALIPFRWAKDTEGSRGFDSPITSLQRDMNRLVDHFFNDFDMAPAAFGRTETSITPSVNVSEGDKEFRVTVELPGVDEKNVELSLNQNVLTIKGEKKFEKEETEKNFTRIERTYGSFYRAIPFATDLDESKVRAEYKKGILYVTLPKAPSAIKEARKIEIKSE